MLGAKWRHLTAKCKVEMVTVMDSRIKAVISVSDLQKYWLIDHEVPWKETDGQSTKFFICIKRRVLGQVNRGLIWNKETESCLLNQFPDLNQFIDSKHFEWWGGQVHWGKTPIHFQKVILLIFLSRVFCIYILGVWFIIRSISN